MAVLALRYMVEVVPAWKSSKLRSSFYQRSDFLTWPPLEEKSWWQRGDHHPHGFDPHHLPCCHHPALIAPASVFCRQKWSPLLWRAPEKTTLKVGDGIMILNSWWNDVTQNPGKKTLKCGGKDHHRRYKFPIICYRHFSENDIYRILYGVSKFFIGYWYCSQKRGTGGLVSRLSSHEWGSRLDRC